MQGIRRHTEQVAAELAVTDEDEGDDAAVAYARHRLGIEDPQAHAARHLVCAGVAPLDSDCLDGQGRRRGNASAAGGGTGAASRFAAVIDSPFREITRPILKYVRGVRRQSPRAMSSMSTSLNMSWGTGGRTCCTTRALRLKGRLLFTPGVMVTNVPWQLRSSAAAAARPEASVPGMIRPQSRDVRRDGGWHARSPADRYAGA